MSKQRDMLKKIVALKRQSAEQRVRALQINVDRIEAGIAALKVSFQELDALKDGFEAYRLSEESGHARKLLADIRAADAALHVERADLHEAREALKRVFYSEECLANPLFNG